MYFPTSSEDNVNKRDDLIDTEFPSCQTIPQNSKELREYTYS